MGAGAYLVRLLRALSVKGITYQDDIITLQFLTQMTQESVLATIEQGGKLWVLVIPAPALTQQITILERHIGIDISTDGVDAQLLDALHKGTHIVLGKTRIHASHAVEVTTEHTTVDLAGIPQLGIKKVGATQFIEGRHGIDHLHGRGWAHALFLVILIEHRIGGEVVYLQTHSGRLEHLIL